jgi:erythritol transport system permease protein
VLILGVTALICGYLLSRTAFGRWLYASGGMSGRLSSPACR